MPGFAFLNLFRISKKEKQIHFTSLSQMYNHLVHLIIFFVHITTTHPYSCQMPIRYIQAKKHPIKKKQQNKTNKNSIKSAFNII